MRRLFLLFLFLFSAPSSSGVAEDEAIDRDLSFCYMNVYIKKPYSGLVYQKDVDELNRAHESHRAYRNSHYSPEDANKMATNAVFDASISKPKEGVPAHDVVNACRQRVENINSRYSRTK